MEDPTACPRGFRQPTLAAPSISQSPRARPPSPSTQPLPRPSFSHSVQDAGAVPGHARGGEGEISDSALEGQQHLQILGASGCAQGDPLLSCLEGYQHPPAALPSGASGPVSLWPVRRGKSVLAAKSSSYIQVAPMPERKQANLLRRSWAGGLGFFQNLCLSWGPKEERGWEGKEGETAAKASRKKSRRSSQKGLPPVS